MFLIINVADPKLKTQRIHGLESRSTALFESEGYTKFKTDPDKS